MEPMILKAVPFALDLDRLAKKLHVNESSRYADDLSRIAAAALRVAKPKAIYKVAMVESRGDDTTVIDGVTLTSRVLRVNLDHTYCVFPYVATSGLELEDWSRSLEDVVQKFWADGIKEMALHAATSALNKFIDERYRPGRTSAMAPGSLGEWPIRQQRPLFAILGDVRRLIGVELSDSCLMSPIKSVSGIIFPTETSFESCQLCPRVRCPRRRAPYDKDLYDQKYRPTE